MTRQLHLPLHGPIFLAPQNPIPSAAKFPKFKRLNAAAATTTTSTPPPPTTTDSGLLFRQKILYLKKLKINPTKALEINPNFRSAPLESLKSVETCLSSMGIESSAFGRIFDMYPQLLTADPYLDLYPIFDFLLNDVGIPYPDIRKSVHRCPRLLICSVDHQLRPVLRFLKDLGFVNSNAVTCQTTVLLVSSVENTLMPKLDYLMGLGLEYKEVVNMVLRSPALLTYSIENNLRPKAEYFVKEMNGDLGDLKRFPQFFSFSLEGKIRRRHMMLVDQGLSLPLWEMLIISDGEFNARVLDMKLQLIDYL